MGHVGDGADHLIAGEMALGCVGDGASTQWGATGMERDGWGLGAMGTMAMGRDGWGLAVMGEMAMVGPAKGALVSWERWA
jgi:hypothetical protein